VQAVTENAGVYTIAQAIQVLVQGFEPTEFYTPDALNPPPSNNLKITNSAASCTSRVPAITFSDLNGDPVPGLSAVNPTIDYAPARGQPPTPSGVPQTHTFTFDLSFAASDLGALFPPTGALAPNVFIVNAAFTVDCTVSASAELELVSTDDPQFYHDYTNDTLWLSGELRVFSIPAGTELFGVTLGNTGNPQQDALSFISSLINTMNDAQRNGTALPVTNNFPPGTNNTVSSFDTLNQLEDVNPLSLALPPPSETGILNFALARVSMQAPIPAANVRVFFRSGRASVTTAAYDAGADNTHPAFYRSSPPTPAGSGPNDVKVPLLGVLPVLQPNGTTANEYVAIPFFAVPRIALNAANPGTTMQNQQEDIPNVAQIPASSGATPVETFFGCWLDINQSEPLFPSSPPAAPSAWDGPWATAGLRPIQAAFKFDMHQCLIAEISFDPITIPPGDVPGISAWLAQRNLGFDAMTAAYRMLSTFDIKPTSPTALASSKPDELMIDWTALPAGSIASIYLPSANAEQIASAAAGMYGSRIFIPVDAKTVRCDALGVTYMPIPRAQGNVAGLVDVKLPRAVHKGDRLTVTFQQLTDKCAAIPSRRSRISRDAIGAASAGRAPTRQITWRAVTGIFQLALKVDGAAETLNKLERNLSILRWIFESIPRESRWHPIFVRYLGALADQVASLGGDPRKVLPSGSGNWRGKPGLQGGGAQPRPAGGQCPHGIQGKIDGLVYDHFGDFEGFILETEDGDKIHFFSRESALQEVVHRAWAERLRVAVTPEDENEHRPRRIVLHSPPRAN
jgi:hypothetical protein